MNDSAGRSKAELGTLTVKCGQTAFEVSYRYRPGQEETLVYLHGLGGCKEDFRAAEVRGEWQRFSILAFDAPGCGATGGYSPEHELTMGDFVEAGTALVDHLGLSDLTVIGHSMGGLAGLLFTLSQPDRVRRFVSIEGNLGPEDCSIYSRRTLDGDHAGNEGAFMDDLTGEMRMSGDRGYRAAADVLRQNVSAEAFFDLCRSIVHYSDHGELRRSFVELQIPRLYVHGAANTHLSHIAHLEDRGIPVGCVPGSDHFPCWSNSEGLLDLLVDFIETTPSAGV